MKTFLNTFKTVKMRFAPFMVFYVIVAVITAVGLAVMNRLSGEMSEVAILGDTRAVMMFLVLMTVVMLLRAVPSALSTLQLVRFSTKVGYNLRAHFVKQFLRAPFSKVVKNETGENLSFYSNDIPQAENFVSTGIMGIVTDAVSFLVGIVFMLIISPIATGVLVLAYIVVIGIQILCSLPMQKRGITMSETTASFNAVVNDSLQNLNVITAYSLEEVIEERYMKSYMNFYYAVKSFTKAMVPLSIFGQIAMFIPLIAAHVVLGHFVVNGTMALAEFITFGAVISMAVGGVMMLAERLGNLAAASASAKRLLENVPDFQPEVQAERKEHLEAEDIIFENVSFTYEGVETPILDNVSFTVKPGSKTAIVGGSGSGKSTVLKLMLGLHNPTDGKIIQQNNEQFSYVPQSSFLFPVSIKENVLLGKSPDSTGTFESACEKAGVSDFINTLPEKYDTVLSESSENISGGQRQRIAIARAFYKNSPVLLLDEATSALDPVTEAGVMKTINNKSGNKTVIMVTHNTKLIEDFDNVIILSGGKVVGLGTHKTLLHTNKTYKALCGEIENKNGNNERVGG